MRPFYPPPATLIASLETRSLCLSALSEVYLLAGRMDRGAYFAQLGAALSAAPGDSTVSLRALSLLCANEALDGHYRSAEQRIAAVEALRQSVCPDTVVWPLEFAKLMVATRRNDREAITSAYANLTTIRCDDPVVNSVAWIADIMVRAHAGDYAGLAAAAISGSRSTESEWYPDHIKNLASALEVLALIHTQNPVAAWRICAEREHQPGHPVCFALLRASIQIHLGQASDALRETSECVRLTEYHSMNSLPSVLLRRAVAYEMLGLPDTADIAFSRSSHLAAELGQVSPALGLPLDLIENLFQRMMSKEPDFGKSIQAMLASVNDFPDAKISQTKEFNLTDRERLIAQWLPTDCSIPEIASQLFVSQNTVKSQIRSIYAKLNATARVDAVAELTAKGFYNAFPVQFPSGDLFQQATR